MKEMRKCLYFQLCPFLLHSGCIRYSDSQTEKGHDIDKANKNQTQHGKVTFTMQLTKPVTSL